MTNDVCVDVGCTELTACSAEAVSTTASTLAVAASVVPTSKRFFLTAADAVSERIRIRKKTIELFKTISSEV